MAPYRLTLVTREVANARVGSLRGRVDFVGDFRVLFDVVRRVAHARAIPPASITWSAP
jgi:hypothetical protein